MWLTQETVSTGWEEGLEKDIERGSMEEERRELGNEAKHQNYIHPSMWLTKKTVSTGCLSNGKHVVFHDIHEDITCTGVHCLPSQLLADPPHHHPQELVCVLLTHDGRSQLGGTHTAG